MSKSKDGTDGKVNVVDVVRDGHKIIVPEKLSLNEAIAALRYQRDYEEQETAIHCEIECFLHEGAWAFYQACSEMFGWVRNVPTPGFFGDTPPMMLAVPVSRTETVQVPWGRIELPCFEGHLETSTGKKNGRFTFVVRGIVKRKHEKHVNALIDLTRKNVRENSIYKGRAFRIRFRDEDGDLLPVPEPKFINLSRAPEPRELIFRRSVYRQIETNIFTMITRTDDVRRAGVPLKRGVLLSGHYGTGKTLCAAATARLAEEHGWTYIECERADEIADVVRLAQSYGKTVVFCEDIDQVLRGERNLGINDILNVIDGVEAKSTEILVVLTTNNISDITQAMIRPGRIDEIIDMLPPDAEAAERLVRLYGCGQVPSSENLSEVCKRMEGQIPAVIRDVVEMSKLYAISLSAPGTTPVITAEALDDAVTAKQRQIELLQEKPADTRSDREKAAAVLASGLRELAGAGLASGSKR